MLGQAEVLEWLVKERLSGNDCFFRASDVAKRFGVSYSVARKYLMSLFRFGFLEAVNYFDSGGFGFLSGFRASLRICKELRGGFSGSGRSD